MSLDIITIIAIFLAAVYFIYYTEQKKRQEKQLAYIKNYIFSERVKDTISTTYPHLTDEDIQLVIQGLRDYFYISNQAKGEMVSMPSQVVDIAWHEFLLFTKAYQNFCQKAFGKFFHHNPVEAMESKTIAQSGIKKAWKLACDKEGIYPKTPDRLPLLFALDNRLNIENGFKYSLNCKPSYATNSSPSGSGCAGYCASHIGCSGSHGYGGDSSSCGGSSCGGGCGGS